jgi:hypothetical protein
MGRGEDGAAASVDLHRKAVQDSGRHGERSGGQKSSGGSDFIYLKEEDDTEMGRLTGQMTSWAGLA